MPHAACPIRVDAPSRIHFGLFSFGGTGRQYGGVGLMVRRPMLELHLYPDNRGPGGLMTSQRLRETLQRWLAFRQRARMPACRVAIRCAPPVHAGLGSGTQLALALVAALDAFCGYPKLDPTGLAQATGRGQRSAVGTYGFVLGGMIVERGKAAGETLAPLECRVPFPTAWPILLVRPTGGQGLSGAAERRAFGTLPPVDSATRRHLVRLAREQLIPAVEQNDFERFSSHLYEYGQVAGTCFAQIQGGPYNGPELTMLVERIRELGIPGVGQSSWGPTLFAVARDRRQAETVAMELRHHFAPAEISITVTRADNVGAKVISNFEDELSAPRE